MKYHCQRKNCISPRSNKSLLNFCRCFGSFLLDSGLGVVISTTSRCGIPLPFDLHLPADGSPFHPTNVNAGGGVFAGVGFGAHPEEMLHACATGKTALPKGAGKLADENELFKQVGGREPGSQKGGMKGKKEQKTPRKKGPRLGLGSIRCDFFLVTYYLGNDYIDTCNCF